ncbi:unnamed protein product [Leuciscus chuanchicus]
MDLQKEGRSSIFSSERKSTAPGCDPFTLSLAHGAAVRPVTFNLLSLKGLTHTDGGRKKAQQLSPHPQIFCSKTRKQAETVCAVVNKILREKESAWGPWNAASVGKRTWRGKGSEGDCSRKETDKEASMWRSDVSDRYPGERERDRQSYDITATVNETEEPSTPKLFRRPDIQEAALKPAFFAVWVLLTRLQPKHFNQDPEDA